MNKQQLAAKIWASANEIRSKIEANEYKDYILGFIFYKFLSDKEESYLKEEGWEAEDLKNINEEDQDTVGFCQRNLGYFIAYDKLFSTWLEKGNNFDVSNVRDALLAFERNINPNNQKLFAGIFETLQTGLSKLGDSAGARTKAINKLLQLIKDIPTDGSQDYDVLGFIYEYLISNFAANAGKKAGEFYTPHEVAILMSEIIAEHLKDKNEIQIYDPTSGSGSLLINIGHSIAKYVDNKDNIQYYAQELKKNTYNLTRMNLIMRGIIPGNIITRNADTLEDDWPYFEESNCERTYQPLYVDAVVSNPPYSLKWDTEHKENDARYARFGLAPKGKADYAFLLHDLFHIKPDGIMAIVLPHGVLFRGGEEATIRKRLIEFNHIDAIIGLPANIFFGTSIPTIIMILKQKRENSDVLIVDASKGFVKEGKNNKLRAQDIKKVTDTVIQRCEMPHFSRKISREEIRKNEYNLNIPRYIDSSEESESWDLYASMFGGIPNTEIDSLADYWQAFPSLKDELFQQANDKPYSTFLAHDVKQTIKENAEIRCFTTQFNTAFSDFCPYLKNRVIDNMETLNITQEKNTISDDIFSRLATIPLIDRYQAYQLLDDEWKQISLDLEMIKTEEKEALKKVDPNMVLKKKKDKEEEVQEGFKGHILPFELIQRTLLKAEFDELKEYERELEEVLSSYTTLIEEMTEEEKEGDYLNESKDKFVTKEVKKKREEILLDIENDEICALKEYITLLDNKATKAEKLSYIAAAKNVAWQAMEQNKDNTYSKKEINNYLKAIGENYVFPDDSLEAKIIRAAQLIAQESTLNKTIKDKTAALVASCKETIESLSDEEALALLEEKWITPLYTKLLAMPEGIIDDLVTKTKALSEKYALSYIELEQETRTAEASLCSLIDDLEGNEFDSKGLKEFQSLLRGEEDERN